MEESPKARKKRADSKPGKAWVIILTHRRKLGARQFMVANQGRQSMRINIEGLSLPGSPPKTSRFRHAMKFPTKTEAKRYLKLYDNPDYTGTPFLHQEEPRATKRPAGHRQTPFAFMEE